MKKKLPKIQPGRLKSAALVSRTSMNKCRIQIAKFVLFVLSFSSSLVWSLAVDVNNDWRGVFAGEISQYNIIVTSEQNSNVLLSWQLLLKGRTLSRGDQEISVGRGGTKVVSLPLRIPPMKPGTHLNAQLIIDVSSGVDSEHKEHYQSVLPVYGPNLLLTDIAIFRQLNIQLFDPVGKTSQLLNELKVPYNELSRDEILNFSAEGLVVVGAGADLDRHRGLMDVLVKLASEGKRVLVLQPSSGKVPLSELTPNSGVQPSTLSFSKDSIVKSFAQGYHWIADDPLKNSGIALRSHRQKILAQVVEYQHDSWDWFSVNFQNTEGRFIICMLPFIDHIHRGPIPQLLFSRLLMYAGGQESSLKQVITKEHKK